MTKQWIMAGLMGATVLGGVAPGIAGAADPDQNDRRWHGRQERDAGSRGENRRDWRAAAAAARAEAPTQRPSIADRPVPVDIRRDRAEAVARWQEDRDREDRTNAAIVARRERAEVLRQQTESDRARAVQQNRRDWQQDRRDWNERRNDARQDRRDDRRDWQQDRRDARRDWRDNRRWDYRDADRRYNWDRDWRRDQRYDWQRYRQTHRHIYRGPRYYAPRGWDYGYRRFSIGIALWSGLYADRYWIDDPWYYRLPPAYGPLRWVRYYDDALLVDIRTGYVVDVIHDFFW